MSSPSQRRGGCGHMMAGFDLHSVCAHCRDKKKGSDPCIGTPPATCSHCDALTAEQKAQLSTLEALLMAKTLEKSQDPVFGTVKVAPAHAPPANVVRPDPFLKPVSQPLQVTDPAVDSPATDSSQS